MTTLVEGGYYKSCVNNFIYHIRRAIIEDIVYFDVYDQKGKILGWNHSMPRWMFLPTIGERVRPKA